MILANDSRHLKTVVEKNLDDFFPVNYILPSFCRAVTDK